MRQRESGQELERALRDAVGRIGGEPPTIERAARAAGLLDVAYATVQTPLGELLLASTQGGLACIAYLDEIAGRDEDAVLRRLAGRLSPRILRAPRLLDRPRRELDEYLAGRRRSFELELDLRGLTVFARRVLQAAARIPYGQTATYAQVARLAGSPRGARAAGNALGANPIPIVLPCHRVVHAGGGLGGYTGGLERKRTLLAIERGLRLPPADSGGNRPRSRLTGAERRGPGAGAEPSAHPGLGAGGA